MAASRCSRDLMASATPGSTIVRPRRVRGTSRLRRPRTATPRSGTGSRGAVLEQRRDVQRLWPVPDKADYARSTVHRAKRQKAVVLDRVQPRHSQGRPRTPRRRSLLGATSGTASLWHPVLTWRQGFGERVYLGLRVDWPRQHAHGGKPAPRPRQPAGQRHQGRHLRATQGGHERRAIGTTSTDQGSLASTRRLEGGRMGNGYTWDHGCHSGAPGRRIPDTRAAARR